MVKKGKSGNKGKQLLGYCTVVLDCETSMVNRSREVV